MQGCNTGGRDAQDQTGIRHTQQYNLFTGTEVHGINNMQIAPADGTGSGEFAKYPGHEEKDPQDEYQAEEQADRTPDNQCDTPWKYTPDWRYEYWLG